MIDACIEKGSKKACVQQMSFLFEWEGSCLSCTCATTPLRHIYVMTSPAPILSLDGQNSLLRHAIVILRKKAMTDLLMPHGKSAMHLGRRVVGGSDFTVHLRCQFSALSLMLKLSELEFSPSPASSLATPAPRSTTNEREGSRSILT